MMHLLKMAVQIVVWIPEVAEHAASLSFVYHTAKSAHIRPVAVLLLVCSAFSRSTYLVTGT